MSLADKAITSSQSTSRHEEDGPTDKRKSDRSALDWLPGLVLAAGFGGSIGLAFLIEMFIDQSIRRPRDIKEKIGMPLFVSIPEMQKNGSINGHGSDVARTEENGRPELQELRPYCDALRDRLLTHFEVKNLTRKPKMVAVTSCSNGAAPRARLPPPSTRAGACRPCSGGQSSTASSGSPSTLLPQASRVT